MPRKTKLKTCVRCGHRTLFGVYRAFYVLKRTPHARRADNRSRIQPQSQLKGSFPATGYCLNCFLDLARKYLDGKRMKELRGRLLAQGFPIE